MKAVFLGVDTSNYTTSLALCDADGKIITSLRAPLPVKEGERGLRQSDAVFAHIKNLPPLSEKLRGLFDNLTAVGYSAFPRDADGSYMPCFLAGEAAASLAASTAGVPLYKFSHQAGHIAAAVRSSAAPELLEQGDSFAAFHVSGGTTDALAVTPRAPYMAIETVGGSRDLHAGQLIDRIGVMLGLPFPCGPALERLALENKKRLPAAKLSVNGAYCNLSGCENMARRLYEETSDAALTAAFTLDTVARTIEAMTAGLLASRPDLKKVVYAGGVMADGIIRDYLSARFDCVFGAPEFSADNAAGAAYLTYMRYKFENGGV